jgi:hypothetical protein
VKARAVRQFQYREGARAHPGAEPEEVPTSQPQASGPWSPVKAAGAGPVEIRLQRGHRVAGTIVHGGTSAAAAGLVVEALDSAEAPEGASGSRFAVTESGGRFELRHLRGGRHTLIVRDLQAWPQITARFDLDVQGDLDGLRLEQAQLGDVEAR